MIALRRIVGRDYSCRVAQRLPTASNAIGSAGVAHGTSEALETDATGRETGISESGPASCPRPQPIGRAHFTAIGGMVGSVSKVAARYGRVLRLAARPHSLGLVDCVCFGRREVVQERFSGCGIFRVGRHESHQSGRSGNLHGQCPHDFDAGLVHFAEEGQANLHLPLATIAIAPAPPWERLSFASISSAMPGFLRVCSKLTPAAAPAAEFG